MSQADPARRLAWRVLETLERNPDILLDVALRRLGAEVDARDAGLARELVFGSQRYGLLYDAVMDHLLTKSEPPPALRRALRLAAQQILGMDRIPPHAIGASTGSLLRWAGHERLVGVANAIIRQLLRRVQPALDPWDRLPKDLQPRDEGRRYGLPSAFVHDLREGGFEPSPELLAHCSRCPPIATYSLNGEALPQTEGIIRQEGAWAWWDDPTAAIAGPVRSGLARVQDPAQMATVAMAGNLQGQWVLDVCAAPGGKSVALAERGARVVAADRSAVRLAPLQRTSKQWSGPTAAPLPLVADGRRLALAPIFDLVLVDAPCSNSGVWGRRPEARYRYTPQALRSLMEIQSSLLRSASEAVKPGGHLLYATCSLTPQENTQQVRQLSGWRIVNEITHWPNAWQAGGYACLLTRA